MGNLKRRYLLIAACVCLAVCIVVAGCSAGAADDAADVTATAGNATEGGDEDGQVTEQEEGVDMTELRDYAAISAKKYSWYIVRDKNHGMSGCDRSFEIEQYDAYYVDRVCAGSGEKVMYLTFDCGYENGYTEQMLDVLKKHDAKACFFVTMTYIRDNPDIVKRMKEEGHQVGNHTVHHPSMPEELPKEQKSELAECADFMKSETGYDMDMYFRPPCGEYSEQVLQLAKDMGYKTIFWSMAYLDYDVDNQPGAEYVIEHFEKYHHPGAIPLIHNVSSSNAAALDTVLTNLEKEGYVFKSLDELNID